MARRHRARFVALTALLADHPDVVDPVQALADQHVQVDGRIVTNPLTRVRADASIRIVRPRPPRGQAKLARGLDALGIDPMGMVAADLGAAAGGFTCTLLDRGARRVYAVDVGHGQLLGSLRQDPRVVNMERTNIADLNDELVPEQLDLITMDLSYLPIAKAVAQLDRLDVRPGALLVALVKPTFELAAPALANTRLDVCAAIDRATAAIQGRAWTVIGITLPTITGANGAIETFISAARSAH